MSKRILSNFQKTKRKEEAKRRLEKIIDLVYLNPFQSTDRQNRTSNWSDRALSGQYKYHFQIAKNEKVAEEVGKFVDNMSDNWRGKTKRDLKMLIYAYILPVIKDRERETERADYERMLALRTWTEMWWWKVRRRDAFYWEIMRLIDVSCILIHDSGKSTISCARVRILCRP